MKNRLIHSLSLSMLAFASIILVITPCGWRVEYAHRFLMGLLRQLKGCPEGSASTAWKYVGLLCNLYRDSGPKRCQYSQTTRTQSPLNPFYTWSNMLLTALHHSTVVSTPLKYLHTPPSSSSLTCTRVRGNRNNNVVGTS